MSVQQATSTKPGWIQLVGSLSGTANSPKTPGSLTGIIIASSDAPALWKAAATYQCTGTADNTVITSAINQAKTDGQNIYLSPGNFAIAATITISGDNITDSDNLISIIGAGSYQTNLNAGTNVTIMLLQNSCKVNIQNMVFQVNGTGDGLKSLANTTSDPYRSFWNSSFKNLLFRGNPNQTNHTGWALNLGSAFRSTFENIEAYNVKNGLKIFSENGAFNPGDCTFTRCFMELGLNSGGIGYQLDGSASPMNHCTFNVCEAFAYGASATGILLSGSAYGAMWNRFWGTNLEQFTTVIDIAYGEGNIIECNYICGRDGTASTIFKTEAGAYNNELQSSFAYIGTSGTIWNDANTSPAQPNSVTNTKIYADSGATVTLTTTTGSILDRNVKDGAGTVPARWTNTVYPDIANIEAGTATGLQIATATTQKLGFYGQTPIVRPDATTDLGSVLSNIGLRAGGTTYGITTSGAVAIGSGGLRSQPQARTGAVTLTATAGWNNQVSASSAGYTITLPAASASAGQMFFFIKTDANTNVITLSRAGSDTINGATTYTALSAQYKYVWLTNNGSNAWYVVANN